MGNITCCSSEKDQADSSLAELQSAEAVLAGDAATAQPAYSSPAAPARDAPTKASDDPHAYQVTLDRSGGGKLGLDVDFLPERTVLPIMRVTGGLAEAWNREHPEAMLSGGDSILEVNGARGDAATMLERCKSEQVLKLSLRRGLSHSHLVKDLKHLVRSEGCGPILVRLSWHDAGVFSTGELAGGCPNAAIRFADAGEGAFEANAGLATVALALLAPISSKYCPHLISNADLWALAANVAIRVMGGPEVPVRYGRIDATSAAQSIESQVGRLPRGDGDAAHLRSIFHPKGIDDKGIVALSGAHTVGRCHLDRSGFDGPWTEEPLRFDNTYFKDLLAKTYTPETTSKGKPQNRDAASGTIMLASDLALITDPTFKKHVELYAGSQSAFFSDFADCWARLQESGCSSLRDVL